MEGYVLLITQMLAKVVLSDSVGAHWSRQQLRKVRVVVRILDKFRRGTQRIYRQYMVRRVTTRERLLVAWAQPMTMTRS
jgi:hypothetical protein